MINGTGPIHWCTLYDEDDEPMSEERREQLRRMTEDCLIARNTRRLAGGGRDGAIPA